MNLKTHPLLMLLILLLIVINAYPQQGSVNLYVSVAGNDSWSGNLPEPNKSKTDGPFATLEKARDRIRELKKKHLTPPAFTVFVRAGKYYLNNTFVLTEKDNGSQDFPISFKAYPGEKPIISGGKVIKSWERFKGNIYKTQLNWAKGGKWKSRQFFYNGKRQTRARWPKTDPSDSLYSGWAYTQGPEFEGSTSSFIYKPGTFRNTWKKPTEVEVIYWANIGAWRSMVPVKTIDEKNRVISLANSGWQFDTPGWYSAVVFTADNRFYVENALEELTEPGEWCFDSEDGIIYFWPLHGKISDETVVPVLDCLVDLKGTEWVTISGFTFTETIDGDNFHHQGVEGAGAMYPRAGWKYCGDAIHLKGARHCTLENNLFYAVGGNAIYLEGYNFRNTISGNEINAAGANGICLLGDRLRHPVFNRISNNHIHHGGYINKYTAGIFSGMSDGNIISHNLIHHLPHHAINLSNSPGGRNIVEYNQINFADMEVTDSGAINCWMEDPPDRYYERCGHVIRFNYISDVYGSRVTDGKLGKSDLKWFPQSGIYLDNYASNCFVYGNVMVRCLTSGVIIHAGKNNIIENNIIIDSGRSITFQDYISALEYWKPMAGFMTGNYVTKNIFYNSNPEGSIYATYVWTDSALAECDFNLFYKVGGKAYGVFDLDGKDKNEPNITYDQWQKSGYDSHSLIADPLFVSPADGNWELKPDSPAFKLGFQKIDLEKVGLLK